MWLGLFHEGKDKTSKLVLVKWENVTLPLSMGVLGIKDFKLINLALLLKLRCYFLGELPLDYGFEIKVFQAKARW